MQGKKVWKFGGFARNVKGQTKNGQHPTSGICKSGIWHLTFHLLIRTKFSIFVKIIAQMTALATAPIKERGYTLEEYLNLEETSEVKHEFHNGKRIEMPGGKT